MNQTGFAKALAASGALCKPVACPAAEIIAASSGDAPGASARLSDRGLVDPTRQGIAAPLAEPDPLPGAAPISVNDALAAVAGWQAARMPLFGIHQIAVALAGEVEQCRADRAQAIDAAGTPTGGPRVASRG